MSKSVWDDIFSGEPEKAREGELRSQLMTRIHEIIEKHEYKNKELAAVLGIAKPEVTLLMNRNLGKFSSDRLLKFLTLLGQKKVKINFGAMPKRVYSEA